MTNIVKELDVRATRYEEGQKIGKCFFIREGYFNKRRHVFLLCECGKEFENTIPHAKLGYGCGCKRGQHNVRGQRLRHGNARKNSETKEYVCWMLFRARCSNPNNKSFKDYGGRGISVCDRWQIFENFLEDMGKKPTPQHSLDRIDVNGNYEPSNCRWATMTEQARNKTTDLILEMDGVSKRMWEWYEIYGVIPRVMKKRLKRGWTTEQAITIPLLGCKDKLKNIIP